MAFTVASYNVLATGYIRPRFYPQTPAALLAPAWRLPALARHVATLDADVLCLQEVDAGIFAAVEAALAPRGYDGHYARKDSDKPDGCAAFLRRDSAELVDTSRLAFADGHGGEAASGHIAQVIRLAIDGRRLGIANTHLKWSRSDIPPHEQPPMRQVAELLRLTAAERNCDGWILCGDFNMTPETAVIAAVRQAGFIAAHHGLAPGHTCNPNGRAKTIDYLFHSPDLHATPAALPVIDDATPLPSPEQPSDHLALLASFSWVAPTQLTLRQAQGEEKKVTSC